jgi:hypothetical protein
MSKTKTILNTVIGAPNSLTALAFQTGEICERERIIKVLENISEYHRITLMVGGQYKAGLVLDDVVAILKGGKDEVK